MIIVKTRDFIFEDLQEIPEEKLDSADAVDYAFWLVSHNNYANRGKFDGNKEKQFYGILSEVIISDLLHYPRPTIKQGYDGGIDLKIKNNNIDIKNIIRNSNPLNYTYTNNLIEKQAIQGNTDWYLLTSFNKKDCSLYIMGYFKKEWLCYCDYYRAGQVVSNAHGKEIVFQMDCYNIANYLLLDVFTVEDLINVIPENGNESVNANLDIMAMERNQVYNTADSNFLSMMFTMRVRNSSTLCAY